MLPYNSPPADIFPETYTENGNTPVLSTAAYFYTARRSSKNPLFLAIFCISSNLKPIKNHLLFEQKNNLNYVLLFTYIIFNHKNYSF